MPANDEQIHRLMDEARRKAYAALSGYKFFMFGYWAAAWVKYNRLLQSPDPSPFRELVLLARRTRQPR